MDSICSTGTQDRNTAIGQLYLWEVERKLGTNIKVQFQHCGKLYYAGSCCSLENRDNEKEQSEIADPRQDVFVWCLFAAVFVWCIDDIGLCSYGTQIDLFVFIVYVLLWIGSLRSPLHKSLEIYVPDLLCFMIYTNHNQNIYFVQICL